MAPITIGKSQKWYKDHCAFCEKPFKTKDVKVKGKAEFYDDSILEILVHEQCAVKAKELDTLKETAY